MASILWFRRDLRLTDHPALTAALAEGEVVPLFVIDPELFDRAGAPRRAFLLGCLQRMDVVVRVGDPRRVVREVAAEAGTDRVFVTKDFGPYGRARDAALEDLLVEVGTPYAVSPDELKPYKVFTPYYRQWRAHGWDRPLPRPTDPAWMLLRSDPLPAVPDAPILEPGEDAGLRRIHVPDDYGRRRDLPAEDGTTRLSAYLKFGCVHPRQVLASLGRGADAEKLRSELAWRDFYAQVLAHWPDTARRAFRPAMEQLEVDHDEERFDAWRDGRTGFPIVDAGMRQLLAESWMHNRVRMITASFLVKDLHLPWQWGARHFMQHLQDGDLASNQHGWQWVAGTGTDPSPFTRVFNPSLQADRFDPDGTYVRRWIPELGTPEYPAPIVDHAAEREEAIRRWHSVPSSANDG